MNSHKKITAISISILTMFLLCGYLFQIGHFSPIYIQAAENRAGNIQIDETNFPDPAFRTYITTSFASGRNYLTEQEAQSVTVINLIIEDGIENIEGIALFPNLVELQCPGTNITSIDVQRNAKLKKLICGFTGALESVKVNKEIEELVCAEAKLTELDVSHCKDLVALDCAVNELTSLDVSQNPKLEVLDCAYQELNTLDLLNNKELTTLIIDETNISSIDISNNPNITDLGFENTSISNINVSHLENLEILECPNTNLTSLDVSNNKKLRMLNCGATPITTITLPEQNKIEVLSCYKTDITTLQTGNLVNLKVLQCENTKIKELDLSASPLLTNLKCNNTLLTSLNVRNNPLLQHLYCHDTKITHLDTRNNKDLRILDCHNSMLMSLDITNNTKLSGFAGTRQHPKTILAQGKNTIDLKELDAQLDVSKILYLQGALLEGSTLKGLTPGKEVTYTYDLGEEMESPLEVTLTLYGENIWQTPLSIADWTYKDSVQQPKATPTWGNVYFLYSDKVDGNYTQSLPINAGTWYVKAYVEENENYTSLQSSPVSFQILPKSAQSKDITITNIKSREDMANLIIKDKDETLLNGIDFDVSFTTKNLLNIVTITFKGNYTGSIIKTFDTQVQNQQVETGDLFHPLLSANLLSFSGLTIYICVKKKKSI